jgi:5-formyltetrahydrofolate cyclo-ligase
MESLPSWKERKESLRRQAQLNRHAQADKDRLSQLICQKFAALPEFSKASAVLCYVGVRDEVRTLDFLPTVLRQGKRLVVPYCAGEELELFLLQDLKELAPAGFGLLEPAPALRDLALRKINVAEIGLIMVPGVAFDRRGARLGHGRGYYDRLLRQAPTEARLVALAFECQLFPEIPMQPHDVFMDLVITEKGSYEGLRRPARGGIS